MVCRIDAEAVSLKRKLDEIAAPKKPSDEGHEQTSEETTLATIEVSLVVNRQIQLNRKLAQLW